MMCITRQFIIKPQSEEAGKLESEAEGLEGLKYKSHPSNNCSFTLHDENLSETNIARIPGA